MLRCRHSTNFKSSYKFQVVIRIHNIQYILISNFIQGPQCQTVKSNLLTIETNTEFQSLKMVLFSRKLNIILISVLVFAKKNQRGSQLSFLKRQKILKNFFTFFALKFLFRPFRRIMNDNFFFQKLSNYRKVWLEILSYICKAPVSPPLTFFGKSEHRYQNYIKFS